MDSPIHNLWYSKTGFPNIYKPLTRFAKVKTDSPYILCGNQNGISDTRFTEVKTASPNFYKPLTSFVKVKTEFPTIYKPSTRFAEVNTDSSMFYKL